MARLAASLHPDLLNNASLDHRKEAKNGKLLDVNEASLFFALASNIPIVSIIVPCFNAGKYIHELGQEVALKSYGLCELILVNNLSSDNTESECLRLSRVRSNVRYINCTKTGAGEARNLGSKYARGIFLYFLDADDAANTKEIISSAFDALAKGSDLYLSDYRISYEKSGSTTVSYPEDHHAIKQLNSLSQKKGDELKKKILAMRITGFPWNRIIKRSLYTRKPIFFASTYVNNDMPFHWASIAYCSSLHSTPEIFCTHLKHASSNGLSRVFDERRLSYINASIETLDAISSHPWLSEIGHELLESNKKTEEWIAKNCDEQLLPLFADRTSAFRTFASSKIKHGSRNKKPRISIITVVRNINNEAPNPTSDSPKSKGHQDFEKMARSVGSQTYGRENIEHIIVDGDSKDGTLEIIKYYHRRKIIDTFISEPDSSVYDAMNKGLSLAQGDYCLFLNADDYLAQDAIELLVNKALISGADYVFADAAIIDSSGSITSHHRGDESRIFFGMPYNHQTLLTSKQVYKQVSFPMNLKITTWQYSINIFTAGFYGAYLDRVVAFFRLGGLSTGDSTRDIYFKELDIIKNELCAKLKMTRSQYDCLRMIAEDSKFKADCFLKAFGSLHGYQDFVGDMLRSEDSLTLQFLNCFFERIIKKISLK